MPSMLWDREFEQIGVQWNREHVSKCESRGESLLHFPMTSRGQLALGFSNIDWA